MEPLKVQITAKLIKRYNFVKMVNKITVLTFLRFDRNGILNLSLGSEMLTAEWTAPRLDCRLGRTSEVRHKM